MSHVNATAQIATRESCHTCKPHAPLTAATHCLATVASPSLQPRAPPGCLRTRLLAARSLCAHELAFAFHECVRVCRGCFGQRPPPAFPCQLLPQVPWPAHQLPSVVLATIFRFPCALCADIRFAAAFDPPFAITYSQCQSRIESHIHNVCVCISCNALQHSYKSIRRLKVRGAHT